MSQALVESLRSRGLIGSANARVTPLTGGVSSQILLVEDGARSFVLKRALPKLQVRDDWFADVSRNRYEQEYLRYVAAFLPHAVPRVLHSDDEQGFFTMEYLGAGYANWKKLLLDGRADASHAARAGAILGAIHHRSWNDPQARRSFDTTENFYQLRIEPYLVTTGQRHPALRRYFEQEAARIAQTRLCLVHGDFSPKNILIGSGGVSDGRMVVLDCEVAWFGDPAFDLAFLFNHFLLKALVHRQSPQPLLALVDAAWAEYASQMSPHALEGLERRVAHLLPMLLLARVDGKSPVEYLHEDGKDLVRGFVADLLPRDPQSIESVIRAWAERLATSPANGPQRLFVPASGS